MLGKAATYMSHCESWDITGSLRFNTKSLSAMHHFHLLYSTLHFTSIWRHKKLLRTILPDAHSTVWRVCRCLGRRTPWVKLGSAAVWGLIACCRRWLGRIFSVKMTHWVCFYSQCFLFPACPRLWITSTTYNDSLPLWMVGWFMNYSTFNNNRDCYAVLVIWK